jgi:hypothetical protein
MAHWRSNEKLSEQLNLTTPFEWIFPSLKLAQALKMLALIFLSNIFTSGDRYDITF